MGTVPPSRSNVSVTCSADSVLASITPESPGTPLRPSTSSDQNSVVRSLMRTQPAPPPLSQSMTDVRASGFSFGSTASSMSRMIWSARDWAAGSKSSDRMPETSSQERAIWGSMVDAVMYFQLLYRHGGGVGEHRRWPHDGARCACLSIVSNPA